MLSHIPSAIRRYTLLVLLWPAAQGLAAPFCLVTEREISCYHTDFRACQQAAAQRKGVCGVNADELHIPPGSGAPFCLINSTGTYCYYTALQPCQQIAAQYKGACVANPRGLPG